MELGRTVQHPWAPCGRTGHRGHGPSAPSSPSHGHPEATLVPMCRAVPCRAVPQLLYLPAPVRQLSPLLPVTPTKVTFKSSDFKELGVSQEKMGPVLLLFEMTKSLSPFCIFLSPFTSGDFPTQTAVFQVWICSAQSSNRLGLLCVLGCNAKN